MKQKYIIFGAIAILLLGGVLVWQKQVKAPTPNEINGTLPEPTTQPPPTEQTSPVEPQDHKIPEGWKTYRNERYGFELMYPSNFIIHGGDLSEYSSEDPREAQYINIGDPNKLGYRPYVFYIKVYDPRETALYKDITLEEFVEKVWKLNKNDQNPYVNKRVGDIIPKTIGGEKGYKFSLSGSFTDVNGSYILNEENLYTFISKNKLKFMMWFPSDEQISQQIFSSFKFIR